MNNKLVTLLGLYWSKNPDTKCITRKIINFRENGLKCEFNGILLTLKKYLNKQIGSTKCNDKLRLENIFTIIRI
jgi:hypothetical protein